MSQVGTQTPPTTTTTTNNNDSNNNGLWDVVKAQGLKATRRASMATHKAKLRAEMMLLDNRIQTRKQHFGMELYDNLVVHAEQDPTFIIDSDTLENIRGHFVTCFKDNKALLQKKATKQQLLVELDDQREFAYPKVPCETLGGQVKNGCKAANFARQETTYKAKIVLIEREMAANKKQFGVEVYRLLVQLEDHHKWLPGDRDVRFLYDAARRDVTKMISEKQAKEAELRLLGLEQQ